MLQYRIKFCEVKKLQSYETTCSEGSSIITAVVASHCSTSWYYDRGHFLCFSQLCYSYKKAKTLGSYFSHQTILCCYNILVHFRRAISRLFVAVSFDLP